MFHGGVEREDKGNAVRASMVSGEDGPRGDIASGVLWSLHGCFSLRKIVFMFKQASEASWRICFLLLFALHEEMSASARIVMHHETDHV